MGWIQLDGRDQREDGMGSIRGCIGLFTWMDGIISEGQQVTVTSTEMSTEHLSPLCVILFMDLLYVSSALSRVPVSIV